MVGNIYTNISPVCLMFKRNKSTVTFRYYSTWWLLASRLKNKLSLIWLSMTNQHSPQSHHLIATILHHTYVNIRIISAVTSSTSILAEKQLEVCSLNDMEDEFKDNWALLVGGGGTVDDGDELTVQTVHVERR